MRDETTIAEPVGRVEIRQAASAEELASARELSGEYASVDGRPCFATLEQELASLPGQYAPPAGRLLLALVGGSAVGCVGLAPVGKALCKMKRLYVRPEFRGTGAGRRLAEA